MLTNSTIRKQEGYSPCNTSCAQHKWDHFFLRNYETNVLLDLKKWTHDKTHFIKRTEEEGKNFFSHYLVSVKNRNSPVTFTLHILIIYIYVHGSFNYLYFSLMSLSTVYKRKKFAIKCIYSPRKMCFLVTFLCVFLGEAEGAWGC